MEVEVLHTGYLVSFHHLPPVAQALVAFPSYGSGSVKAQALQEEVDNMLEIAENLGPGYYSWLFTVQKTTVGWRSVIDLLALSHCYRYFL